MSFVVKSRSTGAVVCNLTEVEEALVADAAGFRVDGVGHASVLELAEARIEQSPDYNSGPAEGETHAKYRSKAGRLMFVEIVRLFHPDAEGYPQLVEVVNPQRPDGSFVVPAGELEVVDLNTLNPALVNAILQGETYEQDGGGNTPKLTKGLRRKE